MYKKDQKEQLIYMMFVYFSLGLTFYKIIGSVVLAIFLPLESSGGSSRQWMAF
jgi:hypothetical protein